MNYADRDTRIRACGNDATAMHRELTREWADLDDPRTYLVIGYLGRRGRPRVIPLPRPKGMSIHAFRRAARARTGKGWTRILELLKHQIFERWPWGSSGSSRQLTAKEVWKRAHPGPRTRKRWRGAPVPAPTTPGGKR